MRKGIVGILGLTVFLCLFGAFGVTTEALAGVEVNVNIGRAPGSGLDPPFPGLFRSPTGDRRLLL
jgi:hypothetical protein